MKTTIKSISFFFLFIFLGTFIGSANTPNPNFAYPKKKAQQAESNLNAALNNGDGKMVVKSLIEYAVAQDLINTDSIQSTITKIEHIADKEKDPCTNALINMLLMKIYSDIYNADSFNINQRGNVKRDTLNDISEWSRVEFTQKTSELYNKILANSEALKKAPLNDYKDFITYNNLTFIYFPTLYDFAVINIIDYLDNFLNKSTFRLSICDYEKLISTPIAYSNKEEELINNLFKDIISFHVNDSAPLIYWDLIRLNWIIENTPSDEWSYITRNIVEAVELLYHKHEHSEYASHALIFLANNTYTHYYTNQKKEFYNLLNERLKRFPAFDQNCEIEHIINRISQKKLSLTFDNYIAPNDELKIKLYNSNCNGTTIDIIRLPDDIKGQNRYSFKKNEQPYIYQTIELSNDSIVPFSLNDTITVKISQPGYYTVVAYCNEQGPNLNNLNIIHCSELSALASNYNITDNRIWVINPKTGEPINNATIDIYSNFNSSKSNNTPDFSIKSSREGLIKHELKPNIAYDLFISKGNDHFGNNIHLYTYGNNIDTTWVDDGTCFTSLPLYHPGDIVEWSAVIYSSKDENNKRFAKNKKYIISFRDANYMEIDTAMVISDNYGRVNGKFTIPIDRLTGKYSITIKGEFNRNVAYRSFSVSDYKLPTYSAKITNITKDDAGNYTIVGEVRSFSDFAIADASVDLDLNRSPYNFYYRGLFSSIYTAKTKTDIEGKFSFVVSPQDYSKDAGSKSIFDAQIKVTSQNGESHETSKYFTNGNPYYILADINDKPIEVSKNIALDVELLDVSSKQTNGTIFYSITDKNKQVVKSGSFASTSATVDWSDIPSGKYDISLHSTSPTATDTLTQSLWLYRTSDPLPPCDNGLWLQHDKYTITKDNSVEIVYGSTFDSGEILYILYDNDKIHHTRWIKARKGIHHTRVLFPVGLNKANIKLYAVNNYVHSEVGASVTRASAEKELKISAESFRNKIIPGSDEQWTFKVTDKNGNETQAAMLMNMYSLAIEKLRSHHFSLYFSNPSVHTYNLKSTSFNPLFYNFDIDINNNRNCLDIKLPKYYLYDHFFGERFTFYLASDGAISIPEEGYANRTKNITLTAASKKQSLHAEVAVEDNIEIIDIPDIPLRENETPLAFFCPMLTTDSTGHLTYSFTVPNANTTWLFKAIAYNDDMVAANFAREVLANKPIMVQPNMPRFLRNGDNAIIKASVMNNSDEELAINTVIELFDPTTNKTIATCNQTDTIMAHQSALAEIEIEVPIDATMIGYRIKSYCNNFGDGEQSLIPILPASSPVIEATTFYMGVDQKSYTQTLPDMPADARVTLEFCENPTWYAVTALPGLNQNQSRTSTSAATAIYSAAIADGIVRQNPQIANAIYQWQHSDKSDSTLVSMLSRNQDLKNMLLSATPWVQSAENDTERMARLSLLFDKKSNKTAIDKNIHLLATLQRTGGGWAWIAECDEASTWSTLSILEKLGHLKRLGFLPDDKKLNSMIENAINYIDAEYVKYYKKYPYGDYSNYVLIRDMFPEYKQSSAAKNVTNTTIQQIVGNWMQYSLEKKATSAMILNNNGYNSTAREILNSINEFSQTSQAKGMWWPTIENNSWYNKILSHANILDAYHQITPNNKDIDKMRQWLIINKEANNWGNSAATSYVIYTLLNTGTRWTRPSLGCEILLNEKNITPTRFDNITGYVKTDISPLAPSGKKLTIAKYGEYPSWGAVYSQFNTDMTGIKAVAGNDISIEKQFLKKEGDAWVVATDYKVGDIIRVQLTIKTKRDIDYVTITDERAACFEPTEQLPEPIFAEGIFFYRENRDEATNIFVTNLPKGTYLLTYDMYVNNEGEFASGIATIQSQYAPQITAHSSGNYIIVSK